MLTFVSLGLYDEKDISLRGLAYITAADVIYMERYTSVFHATIEKLETAYKKKVTVVDRMFVENGVQILEEAKAKNVVFLVIGDVFSATTHISLFLEAKKQHIPVRIVNNASVLTAVGVTGLQLYKFGCVVSVPFHETLDLYKKIQQNYPLHTLCLLDLDPASGRFMEAKEAIAILEKQGFGVEKKVVVCAELGSEEPVIIYAPAKNILFLHKYPQCLIIPGELHFVEEDFLKLYGNL